MVGDGPKIRAERQSTISVPPVPEIFLRIFEGAEPEQIAIAIYDEAAKSKFGGVWHGFRRLQQLGDEGKKVIKQMSVGNDGVSVMAQVLLKDGDLSGERLEQYLGIRRWGVKVPVLPGNRIDFRQFHEHAISRGLTNLSTVQEMLEEYYGSKDAGGSAHIAGTIGNTTFSTDRTVGSHAPTYFELLNPVGILFLRMQNEPSALLLGTYGPYSSDHFGSMMRSINPNTEVHVADINRVYTTQADQSAGRGEKHYILNADARSLGYPENSFNIVATNFLFSFLVPEGQSTYSYGEAVDELKKVFESAFAVLRPGGSFLVLEDVHKVLKPYDPSGNMTKNQFLQLAKQVGFRVERHLPASLSTPLSKEVGTVRPDEYGFTRYSEVALLEDSTDVCLRLVKPRQ